jgi:hypothetical protein
MEGRYSGFMRRNIKWALCLVVLLTSAVAFAERWRNSLGAGDREGWWDGVDSAKTQREAPWRSAPIPTWTNQPGLSKDVFTFARVRYTRANRGQGGYWFSDMPDSDLNLSYRLQQLTSLRADPDGRIIDITDKELFDYPWIYMVEPGMLSLEDDEIPVLRKYLLNGGFMMVDDFWGPIQWSNFESEMKKVFPEKTFTDLETDHAIFRSVFDLTRPKEQLQVPNVRIGRQAEQTDVTWEFHQFEPGGPRLPCKDVHFRALFDEKKRLMVLACHNTDLGDGWEREGEDEYFFRRFAEGISYPMAINIIFYVMTH